MKFYSWEICCPKCRRELTDQRAGDGGHLACKDCDREWPVIAGIQDLRVFDDPYISIEADRAKVKTTREQRQLIPCRAGVLSAVIYANGDVGVCESLPPLGNIWEMPFRKI